MILALEFSENKTSSSFTSIESVQMKQETIQTRGYKYPREYEYHYDYENPTIRGTDKNKLHKFLPPVFPREILSGLLRK